MASVKRTEAKAATRAKLLATAREAFHHRGYDSVRMRDVAKIAGMSTGAIFSNWLTKAELFQEAVGEPAPDIPAWLAHLSESIALVRGDDERAALLTEIADDAMKLRRRIIGQHA